jgi:MFS family permease
MSSADPGPTPPHTASPLLPWLVAVAFFMQSLDTTILNTAVPSIARALHVAPLSMKAVLASYTLSLAVFIPVSGWMANRFGTRRVFAGAIGLFALGSLLCGVSRNIHLLVAFRVLQGCGGAMMVPVGRLTLVRALPKSQLVRAMSFVAVPALIGPMLGPIAGGLLTTGASFSSSMSLLGSRDSTWCTAICRISARRIRPRWICRAWSCSAWGLR